MTAPPHRPRRRWMTLTSNNCLPFYHPAHTDPSGQRPPALRCPDPPLPTYEVETTT